MPSRSITAYSVQVYERGRRTKVKNLSEIGPAKLTLLKLMYGYAKALGDDPDRFRDDVAHRYVPITRVEPTSQILILESEPGYFGLGGATWDTKNHKQERKHNPDDSPGAPVRVLLAQPPDSTTALFFVERVGATSAGGDLMEGFEEAFKKKFSDLNIAFEAVVEPHAWLASASLEQVTIVDRHYTRDVGQGDTKTKVVGTIQHVLRRPTGVKTLPRRIMQGLTDGTILPEQVVNIASDEPLPTDLPEGVEDVVADEGSGAGVDRQIKVKVRGEDGKSSKTFTLANPRTPAIAYDFGDQGAQPSDVKFREACVALIPDLLGSQVEWKAEYHQASKWDDPTLTYRMELPPHGP